MLCDSCSGSDVGLQHAACAFQLTLCVFIPFILAELVANILVGPFWVLSGLCTGFFCRASAGCGENDDDLLYYSSVRHNSRRAFSR